MNGKKKWSYYVKTILYNYGFGDVWEQPYNIDKQLFCAVFKQRLIDNAIQECNDDLKVWENQISHMTSITVNLS